METPVVHIVDDDEAVRDALSMLLDTVGIDNCTYENAQLFLDQFSDKSFNRNSGCIVLDIRMPLISGMECQQRLQQMDNTLPIIFITGHGDVPMAVEAMKRGALEFIQKPFREQELLDAIQKALQKNREQQSACLESLQIRERFNTLTPREKEVLHAVVAGKANKVIAFDLNLSQRTVEIHRARVMEKMQASTLATLVKMMLEIDPGQ